MICKGLTLAPSVRPSCGAREALNPRQLRRDILLALDRLSSYPGAVPGHVENVYQTLADPDRFPEARDSVDKPSTG